MKTIAELEAEIAKQQDVVAELTMGCNHTGFLPSVRETELEDAMLRERRRADILEDENEDPTHAIIARIKAHRVHALEIEAQLREVRGY